MEFEGQKLSEKHLPPHSIEGERSVLGALLLDQNAYSKVADVGLSGVDFYREAHAKIFESIQDLCAKGKPVDLVTLSAVLKAKNQIEEVGGSAYLTGLFEESYSAAHITYYAKIVKEMAVLRRLISTSFDLAERAYTGVEDVEEFLDFAEKAIFDVTDSKLRQSFAGIKDILIQNMQMIQELSEKKSTVTGVPSGFLF